MEYIFHVHKEDSECFHSGGIQKGSRKEASASILEASRKDPENKQVLSFWRHPERIQKRSKCFHSVSIQKGSRKEASAFILEASRKDPEKKQVLPFWRHPERIQKRSKCFHSGGITEGFMEAVASEAR